MSNQSMLEQALKSRFKEGFNLIQVILGPRQVGKTTAIQKLLEGYKGPHLYFSAENKVAVQSDWLDEIWQQAINRDSGCLLVVDEIQKIPNWSERIKFLWDSQSQKKTPKIKVVLLGSSSLKIHVGLSESLTGRFELIRAFHWDLKESCILKKLTLRDYLLYGGYPGSYRFIGNKERFEKYIQNAIVNTIIEKDLLNEGRVRNSALFRQTFQLLQTLPATEISYTKLLGQLQDRGNTDLIKSYLNLYEGAFLFTQIHKFNNKAFKTRISTPKIICMAPALLDLQQKESPEFLGLCFESLVGADLIRTGVPVYYWRDGDFEIDFVVKMNSRLIGVEVKTQKRKSSKSIGEFKKTHPTAQVVYINYENYQNFSADPQQFLISMSD